MATTTKEHRTRRASRRRSGTIAIQLLFALPIMLAFLLGMVEFGILIIVRQDLLSASREAARVAAQGGTAEEVEQTARQILGSGKLAQATVESFLTDEAGDPIPSGEPVAVTVSIIAGQAVPDLLVFLGISIRGQTIAAQTVMRKE